MRMCNMYTAPEAAKKLGVTNFTVYQLINEGKLKATNICNGTKYRRFTIREDDLEECRINYTKRGRRNVKKEEPKKQSPIKVTKPKAVVPKSDVIKIHEAKKELEVLKNDLMDILIRIEEIENNL